MTSVYTKTREYRNNYYKTHKERYQELNRKSRFKTEYGITPEFYEEQKIKQSGRCAICNIIAKLHVDHQHNPIKFRGLLCGQCNRALGLFKDSLNILKSAVVYMENFDG